MYIAGILYTTLPMKAPLQPTKSSDTATPAQRVGTSGKVLVNNRPQAIAQRKLQETITNSPKQVAQRAAVGAITDSSRKIAQRQTAVPLQTRPNRTGLPDKLKTGIENLSGHSLDDVRVHYSSAKPAQIQAHAYAQGSEIHVAPGQEKHLPHEAWHVVQQKQGRVHATQQLQGVGVNDDSGLEREADVMGGRAVSENKQSAAIQLKQVAGKAVVQKFSVSSYYMRIDDQEGRAKAREEREQAKQKQKLDKRKANKEEVKSKEEEVKGEGEVAQHETTKIWLNENLDNEEGWFLCTDSTNKGYRTAGEQQLGGKDNLDILTRSGLIKNEIRNSEGFAVSHLISAEFGGQIKYQTPSDNIRFFPQSIEYGWWQQQETELKKGLHLGRLTASGSDRSASDIGAVVNSLVGIMQKLYVCTPEEIQVIESRLTESLRSLIYVPNKISFEYTDIYEGTETTKGGGEKDIHNYLDVNSSADVDKIIFLFNKYEIPLPAAFPNKAEEYADNKIIGIAALERFIRDEKFPKPENIMDSVRRHKESKHSVLKFEDIITNLINKNPYSRKFKSKILFKLDENEKSEDWHT